jgi:hypothetical protein
VSCPIRIKNTNAIKRNTCEEDSCRYAVPASFHELVREIHDIPVWDYAEEPVIVIDNREGTEAIP